MRKRDIISSLIFLGVGITFSIGSFRYPVWDRFGPGPGFFPLLLGALFSTLSLGLLVVSCLRIGGPGDMLTRADSLRASAISRTLIYLPLVGCFYFSFDRLGSIVTIFIFLITVLTLLNGRSLRVSLTISFLSALMTYVLFVRLLGVPLPGGILQNLIRFY